MTFQLHIDPLLPLPSRLNHNFLNGVRIGEASNPGPQPNAGLQAFIQQAVQQALQQALAGLDREPSFLVL